MGGAAVAWTGLAGLLVGFLLATVFFLRRQVVALRSGVLRLETVVANQDARLFMLEQEQRWLAAKIKQTEYQS